MMRLLRGRLYNRTTPEQGKRNDLTSDHFDTKLQRADRIAKQSGVSAATVKRDAKFAKTCPKLSQTVPLTVPQVLRWFP
jgi:hypothetical protein